MAIADLFKRVMGKAPEPVGEDEQDQRLMDLFQKRNLLKRLYDKAAAELSSTKEEAEALQRQAGEMGKRLSALDEMLVDAEKGQSVIVFYQLSLLWSRCNGLLAERLHELSQRHESEERQQLLAQFAASQREKLAAADEKLRFTQLQLDEVNGRKRQLDTEWAASQRFWHYFKRKKLVVEIASIDQALAPVAARFAEQSEDRERIAQTAPPEYPGLSVAAKRSINLHLIALAQYLYQTMVPNSVAQHVQNTHQQLPNANVYGDTRSCLQLVGHVAEAATRLGNDPERQLKLSQRYAFLQEKARYAAAEDSLPDREAYAAIDGTVGTGTREVKAFDLDAGRIQINVVDSNYFGLGDLALV